MCFPNLQCSCWARWSSSRDSLSLRQRLVDQEGPKAISYGRVSVLACIGRYRAAIAVLPSVVDHGEERVETSAPCLASFPTPTDTLDTKLMSMNPIQRIRLSDIKLSQLTLPIDSAWRGAGEMAIQDRISDRRRGQPRQA